MKLLIWPGHHDIFDGAIKFLTHGKGCHAAFLRQDGLTVHEAFWPRVRDRQLTLEDRKIAEVYELEGLHVADHHSLEHTFDKHLAEGIEYSVADLFRFAFNRPSQDEKHTFCSRYVMHCLKTTIHPSLMPVVRVPFSDWASPRDLRISPRLHLLPHYWQ